MRAKKKALVSLDRELKSSGQGGIDLPSVSFFENGGKGILLVCVL